MMAKSWYQILDINFDERFALNFYTDYLKNGSFQTSNAYVKKGI